MSPSVPTPPEEPASATVIESVARELSVDPTELPESLYTVLDPDALDSLFAGRTSAEGVVTFSYCGFDVTVTADGAVTLGN